MLRSERPTVPPSFDVEQYAKDSDAGVAPARARPLPADLMPADAAEPLSETRLVTRPSVAPSETRLVIRSSVAPTPTDEAWAESIEGAPSLAVQPKDLKRLPLDHRAGFLLSLMDGSIDLQMLVEIAAMPREDALRMVRSLHASGVIEFR